MSASPSYSSASCYPAHVPLPAGFVTPCLPTKASQPPSGPLRVHESTTASELSLARRANGCGSTISVPPNRRGAGQHLHVPMRAPVQAWHRRSFRNLITTCELPPRIAAQAFQRVRTPPPCSKGEGVFLLDSQFGCRTKKDECLAESESLAETQPSLRHAFKHVYGFILQAVKGDKAAADAIFEDYLAGNYPKNCCQFRGVA
jgi:hypothetical protein